MKKLFAIAVCAAFIFAGCAGNQAKQEEAVEPVIEAVEEQAQEATEAIEEAAEAVEDAVEEAAEAVEEAAE